VKAKVNDDDDKPSNKKEKALRMLTIQKMKRWHLCNHPKERHQNVFSVVVITSLTSVHTNIK